MGPASAVCGELGLPSLERVQTAHKLEKLAADKLILKESHVEGIAAVRNSCSAFFLFQFL